MGEGGGEGCTKFGGRKFDLIHLAQLPYSHEGDAYRYHPSPKQLVRKNWAHGKTSALYEYVVHKIYVGRVAQ
jgi:hypothetical protein